MNITKALFICDLHIKEDDKIENLKWVNNLCDYLEQISDCNLLVFVLGDIITGGNKKAYNNANKVIKTLKKHIRVNQVEWIFIPGNHDCCEGSFSSFDKFNRRNSTISCVSYEKNSINSFTYNRFNFILANSVDNHQFNLQGRIDIKSLEKYIKSEYTNVLLLHHSIFSDDGYDHSGLANDGATLEILDNNDIKFVFHGHEHFQKNSIINRSNIFCCGRINDDYDELINENEQFLLAELSNDRIMAVSQNKYSTGNKDYRSETIFPAKEEKSVNLSAIRKSEFIKPTNYVRRRLRKDGDKFSYDWYDNSDTSVEILKKNNRIVVLADAGLGKTTELEMIAYELNEKEREFPIIIRLKNYTSNSIENYIKDYYSNYQYMDFNMLSIIIDGYDELTNFSEFEKQLKNYINSYKESKICISLRSNFYNKYKTLFSEFSIYHLSNFDSKDVDDVLEKNNINISSFREEIVKKDLMTLVYNPFYLFKLIDIYKQNEYLPKSSKVIDMIIENIIRNDFKKFEYSKDDNYEDKDLMMEIFRKTAFHMHLNNLNFISCQELKQLNQLEDLSLIKQNGILEMHDDSYAFSHNIFKEYFVAKHLISLPIKSFKKYTYDRRTKRINDRWFNTIDIMVQISEEKSDFIDWIINNDPLMMINSEYELSDTIKCRIINKQIKELRNNAIWYDYNFSEEEVAKKCICDKTIQIVLKNIKNYRNIYELDYYIKLLSVFGKEEENRCEIVIFLKNIYLTSNISPAIRRDAVVSLAEITKNDDEELKWIIDNCKESNNYYDIYALFKAFMITDSVDRNISIIGKIILNYYENYRDDYSASKINIFVETIKEIRELKSLVVILNELQKLDNRKFERFHDNLINTILNKALLFSKNCDFILIYEAVCKLLIKSIENYNNELNDSIYDFVNRIGKREETLEVLINKVGIEAFQYIVKDIQNNNEDVDIVCRLYADNKFKDERVFESLGYNLSDIEAVYNKLDKLYYSKNRKHINKSISNDNYEEKRRMSIQKYFDSLFCKNEVDKLVIQLLKYYKKDNLLFSELKGLETYNEEYPIGVKYLVSAIKKASFEEKSKVKDFVNIINWEYYQISEINHILSNYKDSILISNEQNEYIRGICDTLEGRLDFRRVYTEKTEDTFVVLYDFIYLYSLKNTINEPFLHDTYIGMIGIPHMVLKYNVIEEKYDFLEKHISQEEIKNFVTTNIKTEGRKELIIDYIYACYRYSIKGYDSIAKKILLEKHKIYSNKDYAIKYLLKLSGEEKTISSLSKCEDDNILLMLGENIEDKSNKKFTELLINRFNSNRNLLILKFLIGANNRYALSYYYRYAKENGKVIDHDNGGWESVTEEIEKINKPYLLFILMKLAVVACQPKFIDKDIISLYNRIIYAFTNCGINHYYSSLIAIKLLKLYFVFINNQKGIGLCSYTINSLYQNKA